MCGSCDLGDVSYAREILFGMLYRKKFNVEYADTFPTIVAKLEAASKLNPKLLKYVAKLSYAPLWMDQMTGHDIYDMQLPKEEVDDELVAEHQAEKHQMEERLTEEQDTVIEIANA
jgi:hypothetical protein